MSTVKNVPIFKIGKHNGFDYEEKDLNEMVTNFDHLKSENPDFKIPIKIGHDNEQEKPAIGWMDNLRAESGFIYADFTDMSTEAIELLKGKQYKNRSIEIIPKFIDSVGKKLGQVIKGIALLGASLPAVNLPDIQFKLPDFAIAFGEGQESIAIQFETEINDTKEGDIKMSETEVLETETPEEKKEEIQEEIIEQKEETKEAIEMRAIMAEIKHVVNDPKKLVDFFRSAQETKNKYDAEMVKMKAEKDERNKNDLLAFSQNLILENKVTPAQREWVDAILLNCDQEKEIDFAYSEFEVKKKDKLINIVKEFLSHLPDRGLLSTQSSSNLLKGWQSNFEQFIQSRNFSSVDKLSAKEYKELVLEFRKLRPDLLDEDKEV